MLVTVVIFIILIVFLGGVIATLIIGTRRRSGIVPVVGQSIMCTGYMPKGPEAVYRYDSDKVIRFYPSSAIASSWDPNWASASSRKINCTGFTLGDNMGPKPEKAY